jgi:mannose-6-phosphate isomerase-like protein (cupin superfamily)
VAVSDKVDVSAACARLPELWSPEAVARVNDHEVRVARLRGEYHWHRHDDTDELFLCLKGGRGIELRDGEVTLGEGQLFVVPRGVEHRPVAHEEAHVVLLEPTGTDPEGTRA